MKNVEDNALSTEIASAIPPTPYPPPAASAIGLENSLSDDKAPVLSAQTSAEYDKTDTAINESIRITQGDDSAQSLPAQVGSIEDASGGNDVLMLPQEQTAAACDEIRGDIKKSAAPPSASTASVIRLESPPRSGEKKEPIRDTHGIGSTSFPPAQVCAKAKDEGMECDVKQLVENACSGDEAPLPPTRTAVAHEDIRGKITNKAAGVTHINEDDAPLPPPQIAPASEVIRGDIEKSANATISGIDQSLPTALVAKAYDEMDTAIKGHIQNIASVSGINTPLPPSQITAPIPPITEQDRAIHQAQTLSVAMPPSPRVDGDTSSVPAPTVPILEATLVEDTHEMTANVTLEFPVYDAVEVPPEEPRTWLDKNRKIVCAAGAGLLVGVAATVVVSLRSTDTIGNDGSNGPEGIAFLTIRPSESSSPSEVPSSRPTLQPSLSTGPSQSPSRSFLPSLLPSTSLPPTPFCFNSEINILTDGYPEETSWTISRFETIDGISNASVLLEGAPGDEGHHTDNVCLERGDYEFTILDSFGDGIISPGYYNMTIDGRVIAHGGKFGSNETVSFSLPFPSLQPSQSPSPSGVPTYSTQPSKSNHPSRIPSHSKRPSLRPSFEPSTSSPPSSFLSTLNWEQQGQAINGRTPVDWLGRAVALSADGTTMAIGAPGDYDNNDRPGHVKVYHREDEGSGWEQRGRTLIGEANGDYFGRSLSLSGDGKTLSVGAPRNDGESGQVTVYGWDESALTYKQVGDTLSGDETGDQFGYSLDLSLDGKTLAVGARFKDSNGSNSGQVRVYAWDEDASTYIHYQTINGKSAGDRFGYHVSLSGDSKKLAVGAAYSDSNGSRSGQVEVFALDETSLNYQQMGDPIIGDASNNNFGWSVSLSADGMTVAVGAPKNNANGDSSGQVKVFVWDELNSTFRQLGQSLYGKAADDRFGRSIDLSSDGNTLAVGARQSRKPGYVETYVWVEAAMGYTHLGHLLKGEANADAFGAAVALSGDGKSLAVGAPYNDKNGRSSGQVKIFGIEF